MSANASDNVGIAGVQFQLDGKNLGGVITGAGPAYGFSWDTTAAANGSHTVAAIASDTTGNTATSSVSVTVNNPIVPPVISAVSAGTPTSSGATITWTTDQASNSQVAYGTTSSYGSLSALNSTLTTSHSVTLTGLAASTTYFYQVQSQSAQGGLGTSGGFTFTTAAAPVGPQPLLQMHLDQTEVSRRRDERIGGDAEHRAGWIYRRGGGQRNRIGEFRGGGDGQRSLLPELLRERATTPITSSQARR